MIFSKFTLKANFIGLFVFTVLFLILANNSFACYDNCIINDTTDLIAGQHTDVGDVKVSNDKNNLYVEYILASGWIMSETHLHVATKYTDIPQKNGNPIPGKFEYKQTHNPKVSYYQYTIPLSKFKGIKTLYIAAHAVVCSSTTPSLPSGSAYAEFYKGTNSLFNVYINGLGFDGIYPAFCIDIHKANFTSNTTQIYPYTSDIISSLISYPGSFPFDYPENMDLVLYVINKYYMNASSANVQAAIWTLIEDISNVPPPAVDFTDYCNIHFGVGNWDQTIVNSIVADAIANGEGYIPPAGGWMGFILINPYSEVVKQTFSFFPNWAYGQAVIFLCRVPKPSCETAWGKGCDFPGNNWAMYFMYKVKSIK